MNNKPWAYVTSAWSADRSRAKRSAKRYCRKLYEAGYTPICPLLSLPEVIDTSNADEYKDYIPGKGCIDNALALVGLKDTGKKKAKDFSLGMRQRLALAIALLGNPEFLVLDEPINGLDPTGIIELRNLLKRLNKERGITILISSHILTELHQLANRYGILHEGKLLQEITATELDKRCKKHLLLQVNDVAAASVLLESKLNTSNFSVMPDKSIHLYDYVENAGKVSALLSANNITIYQLAQSGDSLETYYTNLIGGCQND